MDFDELLNLEEHFYKDGYEEGKRENLRHNYLEGKQYGLQVGFQRYVMLGQMTGICNVVEAQSYGTSIHKIVKAIRELIDGIPLDNKDSSVAIFEKNTIKLRNKFRLLLIALSKHLKDETHDGSERLTFEAVDKLSKSITGDLQGYVEDSNGVEKPQESQAEMW